MKVFSLLALLTLGSVVAHASTTYICFGVPTGAGGGYLPDSAKGENLVYIDFGLGSGGASDGSEKSQTQAGFTNGVIGSVTAHVAGGYKVKTPGSGAAGVGEVAFFGGIDSKIYNGLLQGETQSGGNQISTVMTVSLGQFAANTTYSITLLSARANANTYSPDATFSLTGFGGVTSGITLSSSNNSGTITGDGVTGLDTSNGGAGMVTWTFTTGDQPLDELLLTASGKWSLNALIINSSPAVPEPGVAALGLLSLVGMALRRRRRR